MIDLNIVSTYINQTISAFDADTSPDNLSGNLPFELFVYDKTSERQRHLLKTWYENVNNPEGFVPPAFVVKEGVTYSVLMPLALIVGHEMEYDENALISLKAFCKICSQLSEEAVPYKPSGAVVH